MALYSKTEFAELCGIDVKHISTYFTRGKIILSGTKIDSENPINKAFLQSKKGAILETIQEPFKAQIQPEPILKNTKKEDQQNKSNIDRFEIESDLKEQTLKKLKVDTRIQELKELKMLGENIPVDLVKSVIMVQSSTMITEFRNSLESILTIFNKRKNFSVSDLAEIRKSLTENLNVSINTAVDMSKKQIDNIIKEYSVKKEVGERE